MKIGIIGAGQIGGALIKQYAKAGHEVKMTNASGVEKLRTLERETGAKAVGLNQIVNDIEVLVISIPLIQIPSLARTLGKTVPGNAVIIDTTNYYPIRDGRIDEIENGMAESVWVSNQLSHPVIKVYNSILAGSLVEAGLPKGSTSRIALPASGDDEQEKNLVARLVNDSGFDALDIGSLNDSWRQQPGSPVYCTDLTLSQLKRNVPKAEKQLLSQRREQALQFILQQDPARWSDWTNGCVSNNRIIYQTDLND